MKNDIYLCHLCRLLVDLKSIEWVSGQLHFELFSHGCTIARSYKIYPIIIRKPEQDKVRSDTYKITDNVNNVNKRFLY